MLVTSRLVERGRQVETALSGDNAPQQVRPGAELRRDVARLARIEGSLTVPFHETEQRVRVHGPDLSGAIELGAQDIDHPLAQVRQVLASTDAERKHGDEVGPWRLGPTRGRGGSADGLSRSDPVDQPHCFRRGFESELLTQPRPPIVEGLEGRGPVSRPIQCADQQARGRLILGSELGRTPRPGDRRLGSHGLVPLTQRSRGCCRRGPQHGPLLAEPSLELRRRRHEEPLEQVTAVQRQSVFGRFRTDGLAEGDDITP